MREVTFKRTKKPRKREIKRHPWRPTIFGTKVDKEQVKKLILDGWNDKKVADFLNITKEAWIKWKNEQEDLLNLEDWRRQHSHLIERKLSEVARGYSHPEEKIFLGPGGTVVRAETMKHYPPNVQAIQYWLNNQMKKDWKSHEQLSITGKGDGPLQVETRPKKISLSDFTEEELALIASAGKKLNQEENEIDETTEEDE